MGKPGQAATRWRSRSALSRAALIVLAVFVGALTSPYGNAANTWAVGANTLFIMEYALSRGVACPNCPGNAQPRTLGQIETLLRDLVVNQHVGAFREIVPVELLSPNGISSSFGVPTRIDSSNYALLDSIVGLFRKYNVHLILALGNPIPAWAAPWGHGYSCFLPPATDATTFNTLKNNIAWAAGNYLGHLKAAGYSDWMAGGPTSQVSGGLFIEGFNEWNGNANYQDCKDFAAASPERAALLENAILLAAKYYGVSVNLAAPSVVFPAQGLDGWYAAYYAAGGAGSPNVHIYGNGHSSPGDSNAAIDFAKDQLKRLIKVLPAKYRTEVIWGETGFADVGANCNGLASLPTVEWAKYDAAAARVVTGKDPVITRAVQLLTVWRLDQLADQLSCEGSFGIVSSDSTTYLSPGALMFKYLGGSGVMGKAP